MFKQSFVVGFAVFLVAYTHMATSDAGTALSLKTPRTIQPNSAITPKVDWSQKAEADEWTALTGDAIDDIGGPLLAADPADAEKFCAAFSQLSMEGRRAFWISLLSAMARYESRFDPQALFDERKYCLKSKPPEKCYKTLTTDGRNVVSRGLLQISQESANSYRGCTVPIRDELKLHEPALNLRCSVVILSRLVSRDSVISQKSNKWKGGAAYWSVLRPDKLASIQDFTSSASYCAVR